MSQFAPRTLPALVSVSVFTGGARGCVAILTDASIGRLVTLYGFGQTSADAKADATERYYAEAYDGRSEAAHIAGKKWICKAGEKSKRVDEAELAGYLADGWTAGKGVTGSNIRTTRKLEAALAATAEAPAA